MRQDLELKQQQKLSPLQIQTIKLIELPIQELEQRVRAEIEENPVLDDGPDPDRERDEDNPGDISIDQLAEPLDVWLSDNRESYGCTAFVPGIRGSE